MYTITDIHAHIYPTAIARKAANSIGKFYNYPVAMDGTPQSLLVSDRQAGIERSIIHSVAISADRVVHINDFLMQEGQAHPDCFIPFGCMHPGFENPDRELARVIALGAKGIKIHPDFQRFLLDSPESVYMFEAIAETGLPALIHVGDSRFPYSQPERLARLMDRIPSLRVIGAHLGGWSVWKQGVAILAGRDGLWVDTTSSLDRLSAEEAVAIIRAYGTTRVLFGTDYPMWNPIGEVERFLTLPLTEPERERIFHINADQLLNTEDHHG